MSKGASNSIREILKDGLNQSQGKRTKAWAVTGTKTMMATATIDAIASPRRKAGAFIKEMVLEDPILLSFPRPPAQKRQWLNFASTRTINQIAIVR
ncbi:hypothetical protein HDU83_004392 [Entophlyctis luteolus]|nr:hypothetical protein HDU83_004392 [Entophlyctis luteolus]